MTSVKRISLYIYTSFTWGFLAIVTHHTHEINSPFYPCICKMWSCMWRLQLLLINVEIMFLCPTKYRHNVKIESKKKKKKSELNDVCMIQSWKFSNIVRGTRIWPLSYALKSQPLFLIRQIRHNHNTFGFVEKAGQVTSNIIWTSFRNSENKSPPGSSGLSGVPYKSVILTANPVWWLCTRILAFTFWNDFGNSLEEHWLIKLSKGKYILLSPVFNYSETTTIQSSKTELYPTSCSVHVRLVYGKLYLCTMCLHIIDCVKIYIFIYMSPEPEGLFRHLSCFYNCTLLDRCLRCCSWDLL